ncbi:hypothetical protein BDK51DRAFT_32865, partial [Blyttiomyces helicus]
DQVAGTTHLQALLEEEAGKLLERYVELVRTEAPELEGVIRLQSDVKIGDIRETLCQMAVDNKASTMVVGSRGLGVVKRILLGSVSSYVSHHSKVPVIIVNGAPPGATEETRRDSKVAVDEEKKD